jgi:hypothetical protein
LPSIFGGASTYRGKLERTDDVRAAESDGPDQSIQHELNDHSRNNDSGNTGKLFVS